MVYKLDRISRSTKHLIELSEQFAEMQVDFASINDQIDTSTPMGKFFFSILAAQAQLERDIISERTKSGLEAARLRVRKGGRPATDDEIIERAIKLYLTKPMAVKEIAAETKVPSLTLYKYLSHHGYKRDRIKRVK